MNVEQYFEALNMAALELLAQLDALPENEVPESAKPALKALREVLLGKPN